jgi:predicted nuclease with RNAse H fold
MSTRRDPREAASCVVAVVALPGPAAEHNERRWVTFDMLIARFGRAHLPTHKAPMKAVEERDTPVISPMAP